VTGGLIVVSGLPGVGKTSVAAAVATRLNGVHLSVDPVEDAILRCDLPAGRNVGVAAYEAVLTCSDVDERRRLEGRSRGFARLPEPSWWQVMNRSGDYAPWNCEHLDVDTFATPVGDVCDRICAVASAPP
jgi:hypothetical protein